MMAIRGGIEIKLWWSSIPPLIAIIM
jgi:hypothetical protein